MNNPKTVTPVTIAIAVLNNYTCFKINYPKTTASVTTGARTIVKKYMV